VTYATEVLADSPLHYWRCADPGGVLLHDIGSSPHHLHSVGTTAFLGYSGPNSDGGSIDLSLDGSYANSGETLPFAGGQLTLECIVWSWQHKAIGNQWINHSPAAGQNSIYNDGVNWRGLYNNTFIPAVGVTAVLDQSWTHLALTYDGANGRLYVNGALSGAAVAIAPQAAGVALFVVLNNNGFSHGFVSEISYFTNALLAGRISAHFAAIDQLSQAPVYTQAGKFPGPNGGVAQPGQDLLDIRSAVIHTYQNAP